MTAESARNKGKERGQERCFLIMDLSLNFLCQLPWFPQSYTELKSVCVSVSPLRALCREAHQSQEVTEMWQVSLQDEAFVSLNSMGTWEIRLQEKHTIYNIWAKDIVKCSYKCHLPSPPRKSLGSWEWPLWVLGSWEAPLIHSHGYSKYEETWWLQEAPKVDVSPPLMCLQLTWGS